MRALFKDFVAALTVICFVAVTLLPSRASAAPDTTAPRVLHAVVQKGAMGQNIEVRVQFQDQSEIFEPKLYFRRVGELEYAAIDLAQGAKGEWVGTIPATFVTRDLEYFLEAFDIMGNGPGRNGSPEKPHTIKVVTRMDPVEQPTVIKQVPPTNGQNPLPPNNVTQPAAAPPPPPVYKTWWFWTVMVLAAGAVAGGVTVGVLAANGQLGPGNTGPITTVTIDVRGPDPRSGL
jgi:hypothetical protein